jgi:hypothetical protein
MRYVATITVKSVVTIQTVVVVRYAATMNVKPVIAAIPQTARHVIIATTGSVNATK